MIEAVRAVVHGGETPKKAHELYESLKNSAAGAAAERMSRSVLGALSVAILLICCAGNQCHAEQRKPASGALSILPSNPAYFQSADGTPVILVGDYEGSPTGRYRSNH